MSRWLILVIDLFIASISFALAYHIVFEFNYAKIPYDHFKYELPVVLVVYGLSFLLIKSFYGVIRHTSLADGLKLLKSTALATLLLLGLDLILHRENISQIHEAYIPVPVIVMHGFVGLFLLFFSRLLFKAIYFKLVSGEKPVRNVLIYGAGNAGMITLNSLKNQGGKFNYEIKAFLDDNSSKQNKTIQGLKVLDPKNNLKSVIENHEIHEVILAIQNIAKRRKRRLVEMLLEYGVETKIIPPLSQWINGEIKSEQIKKVRIEDLLGRDQIELDLDNISTQLNGKVVLVTGAAGSIGSEIVRQLVHFNPDTILLLDQSETGIFELENELNEQGVQVTIYPVIADVSNQTRLERIFEVFNINVIYHAAAYKHVPMMEKNPSEAVNCNVRGTKNLSNLAVKHKVSKFVMVSTDKAVNPTNVMGASKRLAEIYVQTLNECLKLKGETTTKFITTRFGNVLGSNGSVIPIFKRQIETGGPVKVTHPDITRYFMTIPEACQLVLEAGAMGKGGEIFIFDMGESVKILDLAKKMIRLSGLEPGVDIEIAFTGLREGEKLYEELLNNKETTTPTHHQKIMIAKVRKDDYNTVSENLNHLFDAVASKDDNAIVKAMKKMVPEFLSRNSVFEKLDRE